jgi:hypothetical protein
MRALRAIVIGIAALVAGIPCTWLALTSYVYVAGLLSDGWLGSGGTKIIVASSACWASLAVAIWFTIGAAKGTGVHLKSAALVTLAVLVGLAGDTALYLAMKDDPKASFPLTFFMWPTFAFLLAGFACGMLPNTRSLTDASGSPLRASGSAAKPER